MHADLGHETLYARLELSESKISVSYQGDTDGNAILTAPRQLLIRCSHEKIRLRYYILFGMDDVRDSYIEGNYEDGLKMEIGGLTVCYFNVFDGTHHAQAKFIYEGSLYIIDITSDEEIDLDLYLKELLE